MNVMAHRPKHSKSPAFNFTWAALHLTSACMHFGSAWYHLMRALHSDDDE